MRRLQGFWIEVGNRSKKGLREGARTLLLLLVQIYRAIGAVHMGGACRFEPSCSVYALEAARKHHPLVAIRLITHRLFKCRPGGPWGWDPVPSQSSGDNA